MLTKNHPEVFRLYNNVYTKDINKKIINNLFLWNKKISLENKKILNNILIQLNEIYQSLVPVINMGITFDLWLVGGSVRDILLGNGKLIKDLDIMISFNKNQNPYILPIKDFMKTSNFNFKNEKLKNIIFHKNTNNSPFDHWNLLYQKSNDYKIKTKQKLVKNVVLFDILSCAFAQKFDLYETYKPSMEIEKDFENADKYLDLRINGVIKIRKDDWQWPVDVLITSYNPDSFIDAFDFGICKVGFEIINTVELNKQKFFMPLTPEDLLKKGHVTKHFLKDVKNQELSMIVTEFMNNKQLKHSCEIHLKKLEEKYPWKINIKIEGTNILGQEIKKEDSRQKYLDAFYMKNKLNKELNIEKKGNHILNKL